MAVTQLSVFLENKPGRLAETVRTLKENRINIRALSLADTKDFGILRLIVSDTALAKQVLSASSVVMTTDVLAIRMDDRSGALSDILQVFESANINVEYMYAFTGSDAASAYVVLRVDRVAESEAALNAAGVTVLSNDELTAAL